MDLIKGLSERTHFPNSFFHTIFLTYYLNTYQIYLHSHVSVGATIFLPCFYLRLCVFNCSTSYLLWPAALSIISWFSCVDSLSNGTGHGWNRCKYMLLFTVYCM